MDFTLPSSDALFGPPLKALTGARLLRRGCRADCWSRPPSSHCGGTVLVHDVDVRVPLRASSDSWRAEFLTDPRGQPCGGIVFRTDAVENREAAADLLRRMENAGGVIGSNAESEEIKAMRCRFFGRYSWAASQADCDKEQVEAVPDHGDLSEKMWELTNGESILFGSADGVENDLLPAVNDGSLNPTGTKEPFMRALANRSGSDEANGGVFFAFPHQEYLFGRVFFDADGAVFAAAFYTYNSPDHWAQMGVADVRICRCPVLPDNCRDRVRATADVLSGLDSEDEALSYIDGFTASLRSAVLRASRPPFVALLLKRRPLYFSSQVVRELLLHDRHLDEMALPILEALPDDVLQAIRQSEVEHYEILARALRSGKPPTSFDTMPSLFSLVCSAERPDALALAGALLRRGFSIHQALGSGFNSQSAFEQAASSASPEVLRFLIDSAGASLDTDSLDGQWNAITHAVYELNADNLTVLMEYWPAHPAWTRQYAPEPPSPSIGGGFGFGFGGGNGEDQEGFEAADEEVDGGFDGEEGEGANNDDVAFGGGDGDGGTLDFGEDASEQVEDKVNDKDKESSTANPFAAFTGGSSSSSGGAGFGGFGFGSAKPPVEKLSLIELAGSGNVNKTDPKYIKILEVLSRPAHPTLVSSLVEHLAAPDQSSRSAEKRIL